MSLPRTIKVGPITYHVHPGNEAMEDAGTHHAERQVIYVNPNQGPDSTADTLLHETLHAIWATTNLDHVNILPDQAEEAVIRALCPVLLETLRSNKALRAALFDG